MMSEMEIGFSTDELPYDRFPLHRACRDGDVSAVCSLLRCAVNHSVLTAEDTRYGWTPIHWAARFAKLECVACLVGAGCDVDATTTKWAQTPLHIAALGAHEECVLWLLQAGADVNRQDYVGESPVHKAARAGSTDCVRTLLIHGAKPALRNGGGLTAADLAHSQGWWQCGQLLSNAHQHVVRLSSSLTGCHAHPGQGLTNGAGTRKRLLGELEMMCIKKARTDALCNGRRKAESAYRDGHALLWPTAAHLAPFSSAGRTPLAPAVERGSAEETACHAGAASMCGSLHRAGSPDASGGSPVSSALGDLLHYGHYHGFGDTAEDIGTAGTHQALA